MQRDINGILLGHDMEYMTNKIGNQFHFLVILMQENHDTPLISGL
jgi:hypothetical protein